MKKILSTFIMLIVLLVFCQNISFAGDPIKKLYRGLANTTTGWAEIFTTTNRNIEDKGFLGGAVFGIPAGILNALWRTSVGIYETVTFPLPLPRNYEPVMEPEFVVDSSIFK